jgi:hypothetical protein
VSFQITSCKLDVKATKVNREEAALDDVTACGKSTRNEIQQADMQSHARFLRHAQIGLGTQSVPDRRLEMVSGIGSRRRSREALSQAFGVPRTCDNRVCCRVSV